MKKSTKLNGLIEAHKSESVKMSEQLQKMDQLKETITTDLEAAKASLPGLIEAVIADPSEINRKAEAEVRAKIESLEKELSSTNERKQHAFQASSKAMTEHAREAVQLAKEEGDKHIRDNYDAAVKAIEEAKYAYLKALVAYHKIGNEARKHFHDTQKEVNTEFMSESAPYLADLNLFYTGGQKQVHGITQLEALDAMQKGIIRKTSVADGREINDSLYS